MKTSSNKELSPSLTQTLTQMGGRIRQARLRRRITQGSLASQIDSTMVTIAKVEKGDPSVSLGIYAKVLEALQLQEVYFTSDTASKDGCVVLSVEKGGINDFIGMVAQALLENDAVRTLFKKAMLIADIKNAIYDKD